MLDIALNQGEGVVTLRDISRRQAISQKYLWQVINPLKAAGILRTVRGVHGGYALARPPEAISIRDLVEVLEGDLTLVTCVAKPETCERSIACTAREAWSEIETQLNAAMRGITLKDLIQRQTDREARSGLNYDI